MERIRRFMEHPRRALFSLAAPTLIGMLVQTTYNIVDTAFVGRLGPDAIAALTFAFPLFIMLFALNSGIAIGMGSLISRSLGAGNKKRAENAAMHGLVMSILLAIVLAMIGIPAMPWLFELFGASGHVLQTGVTYMRIVLAGIVLMFTNYIIHYIFSSQGDTRTPMVIQIISLLVNIALDPIFIYVLGFGAPGAAMATVCAFTVGFVLGYILLKKKSQLTIEPRYFRHSWPMVKNILSVGIPATLMMMLISISQMVINRLMVTYSVLHVAMYGLVSRLESLMIMPSVAFASAAMTLVGMFFGARRYDLLKDVVKFTGMIIVGISIIAGSVFILLPKTFLQIFTDNPEILSIGAPYLRIEVLMFPFLGLTMLTIRALQGMGFGLPSLIINLVRIVGVTLPLAFLAVLVFEMSYLAIAVSLVIGSVVSMIMAWIWFGWRLKRCLSGAPECP